MGKTNLRLLLDESITEPLAGRIMELVPSAIHVRNCQEAQGRCDDEIAAFAHRHRRLLVAVDGDFKKLTVKSGVIKLNRYGNDDDCLFAIFRAFWQSGWRMKSRQRRTFLSHHCMRIVNGEESIFQWEVAPCPHRASGR